VVRLLGAVVAAAVIVTAALVLINRDPAAPVTPHVAIAPGASVKQAHPLKVTGTTMSAKEAIDAAVEDGIHPDLVPLPTSAFDTPIAQYRAYAAGQARLLIKAAGRRDWAAARDHWLLMGAAYGAFGDLETEVTDAIDRHDGPALSAAARKLPAAVRKAELSPLDYATRAHEILEDAQRDLFSVRDTADGVVATRKVMATLHDVLAGRGSVLQQVDSRLARLEQALARVRRAHGGWPAHPTQAERELLTGRLGAALEALAGVPGALETALPPKIPAIK
jgi:high-affinity iron transporter